MFETIRNAKLIEVGNIRSSLYWSSIYLKFKIENGKDFWFEISVNNSSPDNMTLIHDFSDNIVCKIGMTMTLNYEIKQSINKSRKLYIRNYLITDFNESFD